jgi:hypothetical protein
MEWLWTWLKQPSSLRVINIIGGLIGVAIEPELWREIMGVAAAVYIIIDGFYNKQPAKPE